MVGDNIFDATKGKSKDYYTLLIREKAKPPNIIQHFNSDHLKQIFKLPHSIVVESYVKAFQYKVINSILYTNTKLYKIGYRTNDLCTFCDNQPESLTHLFYHCSRSKHFWVEFELYWCLISNQRIRLCLENVLIGILTENACPLLQLLNYFIAIGKLYLWDCKIKQILPNIYRFRAKIIAKYETEKKIGNKEFFKEKVDTDALFKLTALTPYSFIALLYFFLISFSPVIIQQLILFYSVNVYC